jgi:hypothetical protein
MLKIMHLDILTLQSSPFASLALECTTRLLMYTSTILSIAIVIVIVISFSILSFNRDIVNRGNLVFCQCRKVLMVKPVANAGVVFMFEHNAFTKEIRNLLKQVIICL